MNRRNPADGHDEFRETLAAPVPSQGYQTQVEPLTGHTSGIEQVVRLVAGLLGAALAVRFVVGLFVPETVTGPSLNVVRATTDWLVRPLDGLFGQIPLANGAVDLSALAGIVIIGFLAAISIRLLRPTIE